VPRIHIGPVPHDPLLHRVTNAVAGVGDDVRGECSRSSRPSRCGRGCVAARSGRRRRAARTHSGRARRPRPTSPAPPSTGRARGPGVGGSGGTRLVAHETSVLGLRTQRRAVRQRMDRSSRSAGTDPIAVKRTTRLAAAGRPRRRAALQERV